MIELLNKLKGIAFENENKRNNLLREVEVMSRLTDVFGPRGIQHFVFIEVIQQLEEITNAYLSVLTEGGMQITLQSDGEEGEDKIIKTIHMRSSASLVDGSGIAGYRVRALSQLSGGQWRRASLALDLAFVEMVRRRGLLTSNLIGWSIFVCIFKLYF